MIKIRVTLVMVVGLVWFFLPSLVHAEGNYVNVGTAAGGDAGDDGINFSQGRVWTVDQYGKYIWMIEDRGGSHYWAWSNDSGSNWIQGGESYGFLTRASVVYDSINDKLHVIWQPQSNSDGIIYRRYGITRDGSHNITAISREDAANINLQLDTSALATVGQVVAWWNNDGSPNGTLVAIWSKYDSSTFAEVRGSMRQLSLSAADGVAANWKALDGTGDVFSLDPPLVEADKIFAAGNGDVEASAIVRGGSGSHSNDFYVFASENNSSFSRVDAYRATWNSGSKNWSGGFINLGVVGQIDNSGGGYNLKGQLLTKPVLDTINDRLYVGWARWKDNTSGDTVSIAYLGPNDAISGAVDVYSANGAHSYAPTLDIAYDGSQGLVYVAYVESTTNGDNASIDYKTYDGSILSTSTRFYTSPGGSGGADGGADIPILYENRYDGKLLVGFRVNGALPPTAINPHKLYVGYVTLPSPTPTLVPNNSVSNSQGSSQGPFGAKSCTDVTPPTPNLFAVRLWGDNSAKLFYTIGSGNFDRFAVEYGRKSNSYEYSYDNVAGINDRTVVIGDLAAGVKYYFRIRAGNGCMPGGWSNELSLSLPGVSDNLVVIPTAMTTKPPIPTPITLVTATMVPALVAIMPTEVPIKTENVTNGGIDFIKLGAGVGGGLVVLGLLIFGIRRIKKFPR